VSQKVVQNFVVYSRLRDTLQPKPNTKMQNLSGLSICAFCADAKALNSVPKFRAKLCVVYIYVTGRQNPLIL
jgi:hypothetical protein